MRKTLFLFTAAMAIALHAAEIPEYSDHFKKPSWRIINTPDRIAVKDRVMLNDTDKRLLPTTNAIRGSQPVGTKFRFSITNTDSGKYKLGFMLRDKRKKHHFYWSDELTGSASYTFTLPLSAQSVTPLIQGKGRYKTVRIVRLLDYDYRIEATPAYQLVEDPAKAEPVKFQLFYKEKAVPGAKLTVLGPEAYHESGATARAYVIKGDPAPFKAVAKNIKIQKPVDILYIGDSLTHFDIGLNHVDKVGYFLNMYNPGKVRVWNYACGGDYTARILNRFNGKKQGRWGYRYDDIWLRSYDWAIIFLGHNDTKASSKNGYKTALVPPEQQKNDYEKIIALLKSKGVKRIILMSSSSSNFELCKKNADKIGSKRIHSRFGDPVHQEAFNRVLQELAKKHKLEYFDLYTPMKAVKDKAKLLNPLDGVHLTPEGHDYVAIKTLEYLAAHQE